MPKLILASTSPRRRQLLQEAGYRFEACSPSAEEGRMPGESPRKMVARLARAKAASIGYLEKRHVLVVGSDTTVVTPNGKDILEKPIDARDGERMLKLLSGKTHVVLTAVSIQEWKSGERIRERNFVVTTRVTFRKLATSEIRLYARSPEPRDKAGSYAAQGKGLSFISEVKGSYSSVIGFPVAQFIEALKSGWGVEP